MCSFGGRLAFCRGSSSAAIRASMYKKQLIRDLFRAPDSSMRWSGLMFLWCVSDLTMFSAKNSEHNLRGSSQATVDKVREFLVFVHLLPILVAEGDAMNQELGAQEANFSKSEPTKCQMHRR